MGIGQVAVSRVLLLSSGLQRTLYVIVDEYLSQKISECYRGEDGFILVASILEISYDAAKNR
jgi:hypothetical protein